MASYFAIAALAFCSAMALLNLWTAPRLDRPPRSTAKQTGETANVSILVPARNEAHHLKALLPSLLASDYPASEILVLDDQSSDETASVTSALFEAARPTHPARLTLLTGASWTADSGMNGKNHACQQLADAARGDYFLFCDADVTVSSQALGRSMAWLSHAGPSCAGVTGLPQPHQWRSKR